MYTLEFDTEIPKICIPIVGTKEEEIIKTAEELVAAKVDLIEWRADYCSCILEDERLCLFLQKLRRSTGSIPLLFTIRTTAEGGELTISFEQYIHTLQVAAQSECVDYIDVEMFWWDRALSESESVTEGTIREAVQALQQHVQVIGSYHDFRGTPQEMQITKRLLAMHENGADIPKMAVMPQRKEDVLALMCATLQAKRQIPDTPVITMSMGALGSVSRVAGANFGSAVTFGCYGETSAPGQIPLEELRVALKRLQIS